MSNELNEYLESKGVSTHLNQKRTLAKAFGLPMDNGTDEQQSALLRALKVGAMATADNMAENFKVEIASFDLLPAKYFDMQKTAESFVKENPELKCRITRVISISEIL